MELQQIIGFYHVANQQSFTKAAVTTFRTQSALSHQVKALETELECQLIERVGRRKLQLTPAGKCFYEYTKSFLRQQDQLFEDINEIKGNLSGRLKIAAQPGPLLYVFPKLISNYREVHPEVDIRLFERSPMDIIHSIKAGDVDFGIASDELIPGDLSSIRWRKTDPFVVTPKNHPLTKRELITLSDLSDFPLILTPKILKYSYRRMLEKKFAQKGLKYKIAMEASTFELASTYVELGFGIAFAALGYEMHTFGKRNVAYTPIDHLFEPIHFALVMRKGMHLRPYQEDFIHMFLEKGPEAKPKAKKR